ELLRQIGRGSYGDVWLARGATGLWRAVKIVWRERFADAEPFEREWRGLKEFAAISLGESSHMALLHIGRNDAAGFFFYVMELADDAERGRAIDPANYVPLTLTEVRKRRHRLPAAECVTTGADVARTLAKLHARGLVHRDIKPSNVILVDGAPKLADIGLVAPMTSARTFVGTEGFVPPEGPGSPSADVFALGKVLYELATGLDRQDFPQLPSDLSQLPDHRALLALNEVILRACEAAPEKRYRDATALLADLERLQAGQPVRRAARWPLMAAAAALTVLAVGAWLFTRQAPTSPTPSVAGPKTLAAAPAPISDKSIAVLPFANLSPDQANAFFADGVHEEVLSKLTSVAELRVISKTSVSRYRDTKKTGPEIGRELEVAYLLEGSVRREGNLVRVTGTLIDARADRQVRALTITKSVTDVFSIQAELAQTIAAELQAVLDPGTKKQLERRPTASAAAYEAYLKGRALLVSGGRREKTEEAEKLFQSAVDADPNFAEAWAELAVIESIFLFQSHDLTPARRERADAAMAKALLLAPEAPEVQRAQANFTYNRFRDYARATAQLEALRAKWPNDASLSFLLGVVQRRNHRWADSLANLRRAVEMEPANLSFSDAYEQSLSALRMWEQLWAERRRTGPLRPGGSEAAERELMFMKRRAFASRVELDAYLAGVPAAEREQPEILDLRQSRARERGDLAAYRRLDQQLAQSSVADAVGSAFGYAQLGDPAAARARLGDEPEKLRAQVAADPNNSAAWQRLGLIEALLGRHEEARRCAAKATELMSEPYDPYFGPQASKMAAIILAWCGEKDRALAELRRLALLPAGYMAAGDLAHRHLWTPLRDDPRFREIITLVERNSPLPLVNGPAAPVADRR
ncbi:MAG: protein kinase, partial [Verrucomicrobia bacterium]|nr:protein kinase [Verrucomicrobiota bacterium]